MPKLIYESLSLITAIIIGGFAFRYMNKFLKLFWWQLVIWAITLVLMYIVPILQKSYGLEQNNTLIANTHMLFEYGFILTAAYLGFKKTFLKRLVLIGSVLIYGVWILEIFVNGIFQYLDRTDLTACFVLTVIFTILIYQFFHEKLEIKWYRRPELVISIGVLVFFAGSLPYVSIMNFLIEKNPTMNTKLLTMLSDTAANIYYICAAIAFFLVIKNRKELQK